MNNAANYYGRTISLVLDNIDVLLTLQTPGSSESLRKRKRDEESPAPAGNGISQGDTVVFRHRLKNEVSWIQCVVLKVSGEGSKARYEIQDPEPDDYGKTEIYKTTINNIIPLPPTSAGLAPLKPKMIVLAQYPDTTTFYKAEVVNQRRDGACRLRFEGEEMLGREPEVERRLIVEYTG